MLLAILNNEGAGTKVSGDGAVLTDVDGKTYIDLLGGIAVNILGLGRAWQLGRSRLC